MPKRSVLILGNLLSRSVGTHSVGEDLAYRLRLNEWSVVAASSYRGRLVRLIDMLLTSWKYRHCYEVVYLEVYSGPALIWAEISTYLLRGLRKPVVLALHGGNLPTFAQRWPRRVRRLLQSAAVVTAPSHYLLEAMQPYRGDLRLLPNPVDSCRYDFRLRRNAQAHFVWLRAFHGIYNPSLAARVVAALVDDFPDIQLTMVGPDKGDGSLQYFQQLATELGIRGHIVLAGAMPKSDVPLWLHKGDIFINTTNVDNTPISVIEAMTCGLCVVSTNVGGIPYLLEHEHDALLVPPDDPEAMANAARRILTEPRLAETLSRNARTKAEQFDWSVILPQWEQLLLEVGQRK